MNIFSLEEDEEQEEQKFYKSFEEKRNSLIEQITKKRNELLGISNTKDSLKKPDKVIGNLKDAEAYGEDLQKKSKDVLLNIKKTTEEDIKKAALIENQIEQNKATILRIEDEREKMEGTLKRVGKHLAYFAKTMASDKLLICLVFTAVLAIIGAVACYFIFGSGSGSTE